MTPTYEKALQHLHEHAFASTPPELDAYDGRTLHFLARHKLARTEHGLWRITLRGLLVARGDTPPPDLVGRLPAHEVVGVVRKHPGLTCRELSPFLEVKNKTAGAALSRLAKAGRVRREGTGRTNDPYRYHPA